MRRLVPLIVLALTASLPSVASAQPEVAPAVDLVRPLAAFDEVEVIASPTATLDLQGRTRHATDEGHLVQVQVLHARIRSAHRPRWASSRTVRVPLEGRRLELPVAEGRVVCVRAREVAGAARSPWTTRSCTSRMIDDRHLPTRGDVRRRADDRWDDGSLSTLGPGGRLVLGRVPAGAIYGPVVPAGRTIGPSCLVADRRPAGRSISYPDGAGRLFLRHRAATAGRLVCASDALPRRRVGGLGFLPRWAQQAGVRAGAASPQREVIRARVDARVPSSP